MYNPSRIDIYDYLYNLFYDVVTKNVYSMREPQELTASDTKDGFIVLTVGSINDTSEFSGESYGRVRCYVEAFVPPISRGRLDYDKYKVFEDKIIEVIKTESNEGTNENYSIEEETILSSDVEETSNSNNTYFVFIKSFIVNIFNKEE